MSKKPASSPTAQFGLFADLSQPVRTQLAAPRAAPEAGSLYLNDLGASLQHPYSRYGLAVAAYQARLPAIVTEAVLRTALVRAIESGLGAFRMRTWDNSLHDKVLKFEPVRLDELTDKPQLVQSAGLAAQGIYLYPTVLTTDGNAKDTFRNAQEITKQLRKEAPLSAVTTLSRSFAPTTAKINNGIAYQRPPEGTLLEAACALITAVTPLKPAAWPGQNTVIIPDLPFEQLRKFLDVFEEMTTQEVEQLLHTRERPLTLAPGDKAKDLGKAGSKSASPEFRRPRIHSGNYPDAPRDAGVFGPVGLLGAIGRWARRTKQLGQGKDVLDSLAGQPLLIISYDQISQVRFDHHTTRLALAHDLTHIVDSLYLGTRLYSEIEHPGTPFGKPAFKTFCLMASRFLQSFTPAAFTDFLAFRAEYAAEVEPLFTEYFRIMKPEIVQSASALGRWLNRTAFFAARDEAEEFPSKKKLKDQQIKETKAKILIVLESAVLSAKTPEAMVSQVLRQAGQMLLDEAPAEARRFVDATNTREITHDQAKHLLIAYMRLRSVGKASSTPSEELITDTLETSGTADDDQAHNA